MIGDRIGDRGSDRIGYRELKKIADRIGNRIGYFFLIGTTLIICRQKSSLYIQECYFPRLQQSVAA